MAKVYYDLIVKKAICPKTKKAYTLEDVPKILQKDVKKLLEGK